MLEPVEQKAASAVANLSSSTVAPPPTLHYDPSGNAPETPSSFPPTHGMPGIRCLAPHRIKRGRVLGKGGFGEVYQATYQHRAGVDISLACKAIHKNTGYLSDAQQQDEAFEWEMRRLALNAT